MPPRSPADATRFTANGLHANRKPHGSNQPPSSASKSGPPGETPQQKVARLRAAALQARQAQEPSLERWIAKGRTVADRAHRAFALGLIALTGVSFVVATYGLGDMILYNRRKKREYFASQKELLERAMVDAKAAARIHRASQDQIDFLYRHEMLAQVQEEEKARGGFFKRSTRWLFGGLKTDDDPTSTDDGEREAVGLRHELLEDTPEGRQSWVESRLGIESRSVGELVTTQASMDPPQLPKGTSLQDKIGALAAFEREKVAEEVQLQNKIRKDGGILDQLSQKGEQDSSSKSKSWSSWLSGR